MVGIVDDDRAGRTERLDFGGGAGFASMTIAPACPMRVRCGALLPTMQAKTGLVMRAWMKFAASISARPPISPISRMRLVSGSSSNIASTSTKLVPIIGSPPMPTMVDCPIPLPSSDRRHRKSACRCARRRRRCPPCR